MGLESKRPAYLPASRELCDSAASALADDALFYDARSNEHQELGLVVRAGVVAEQHAEQRQVSEERHLGNRSLQGLGVDTADHDPAAVFHQHLGLDRSEERRVGKECRSRWSPYH